MRGIASTAEAFIAEGKPLEAVPHLRTVLHLDSLSLVELTPSCLACEAFWHMGAAYSAADSMDAALRTWERWARATPSRRASFGPRSAGYARTNIELAHVLLAAYRPREALRPLRLNLESSIGADQTWALRTEARELLGLAHDRLGHGDSARVHYTAVLDAWRHADPELHPRRRVIEANLHSLIEN